MEFYFFSDIRYQTNPLETLVTFLSLKKHHFSITFNPQYTKPSSSTLFTKLGSS